MEEKIVRLLLVGLALATMGSTVAVYLTYIPVVQSVAPSFLNTVLCANSNGTYVYSQPTSSELCSSLSQSTRNMDARVCEAYPAGKQVTCTQLMADLKLRQTDCFGYLFTNQTEYGQGFPAVAQDCKNLVH